MTRITPFQLYTLCCGFVLMLLTPALSAQTLACNGGDLVVSPLPSNCRVELNLSNILSGMPNAVPDYTLSVFRPAPSSLLLEQVLVTAASDVIVIDGIAVNTGTAYTFANRSFRFELVDNASGNSCSRNLSIGGDNTPPTFTNCPTGPVQAINCFDAISSLTIATPSATDACGGSVAVRIQRDFQASDVSCPDGTTQTSFRIYEAEDAQGNRSTCEVSITINPRVTVEDYISESAPQNIQFTCSQYAANPNIVDLGPLNAGIVDANNDSSDGIQVANTTSPTIIANTNAGEFVAAGGDFCNYMGVFLSEQMFATCGGAVSTDRPFKIERRFNVMDPCTGVAGTPYIQVISVISDTDPVITVAPMANLNANVSGGVNGAFCSSSLSILPQPTFSAPGCAALNLSSIQVITPAGPAIAMTVGGTTVYQVPAPGLPIGGPYTISYSIADSCGGTAMATSQVSVVDNTPPIAVCDQITAFSLTTTTNSALLASNLDDGSSDFCQDVFFKVLRMDELAADPLGRDGVGVPQTCDNANSNSPTEPARRSFFDDEAFFCCEDIPNNNNMVVVRVFDVDPGADAVSPNRFLPTGDLFGRFNDCMVEVKVEDKLAPVLVLPAADRTLTCNDNAIRQQYLDATQVTFDAPVFLDACDFTVSLAVSNTLSGCSVGTITRTFTATDINGNTSVVDVQVLSFVAEHNYTINFPDDINNMACGVGINLADTLDDSDISEDGCDLLAISFTDQVFTSSNECKKILRTYDIINWCEWDGTSAAIRVPNPTTTIAGVRLDVDVSTGGSVSVRFNNVPTSLNSVGRWSYVQHIKFKDVEDPVAALGTQAACVQANTVADVQGLGCGQTIARPFTLTDNCATSFDVDYYLVAFITDANNDGQVSPAELLTGTSYENDLDTDPFGTITGSAGSYSVNGTYPLGFHAAVVTASDQCGNAIEFLVPFTAEDCKSPTPKAVDGIAIGIMATGMVNYPAMMSDNGSSDACGAVTILIKRIGDPRSAAATSLNLTCADRLLSDTVLVDLIVIDESGNEDFVQTYISLQAQNGACGTTPTRPFVQGNLGTDAGNGLQSARVTATGNYFNTVSTDASGNFQFDDLTSGDDVTIAPGHNVDLANGVTTFDFLLIGRHVLNIDHFTSPELLIAADVNNSGSVSAFDLTALKRVILGLDANFPNGQQSWRFVDAGYVFPNANNPWSQVWPETVSYNDVVANIGGADFTAIKIGDVNGSARSSARQPLAPRTLNSEFALVATDATLSTGETHRISFQASDVAALGYQFTMEWDASALELVDVTAGSHEQSGFGTHLLQEGKLTLSHTGAMEGELFSLEVRALRDGVVLSEALSAGSSVTTAEAYTPAGDAAVALQFAGSDADSGYALDQNRPNPFAGTTLVSFTLAEAGETALTITDVAGRVVWRTVGHFDQGTHQVEIAANDLSATGVLHYTLTSGGFTATRKMVIVE